MSGVRRVAPLLLAVAVLAAALLGLRDDDANPRALPALLRVGAGAGDVATAFAYGRGRAVTVAHVLGERGIGAQVSVRRPGDRARSATVVDVDQRDDVAVLAVPGLPAAVQRTATVQGDVVVLLLRGDGVRTVPAEVRRAIDARIRTPDGRHLVHRPALELEADIRPGDSGAPVLTPDGRVAGIVFARSERRTRIAYAVDASVLAGSR